MERATGISITANPESNENNFFLRASPVWEFQTQAVVGSIPPTGIFFFVNGAWTPGAVGRIANHSK